MELKFINKQILADNKNNQCVEINDYNGEKYDKICEQLEVTMTEDLDILNNMENEEIFEILFELGEGDLEDLMFGEYSDDDTDE